MQQTALHEFHRRHHARMVDFAGWDMPVSYQSVLEEHHAVRKEVGLFDVSHMTILEIRGAQARDGLRKLLANDVARLNKPGQAMYSAMLNEQAGILDDVIVYAPDQHQSDLWRMIVNCATHDKDMEWIRTQWQELSIDWVERTDLSMLALQGPKARSCLEAVIVPEFLDGLRQLSPFQGDSFADLFVARTGYTGEDGFEIILPHARASEWAEKLCGQGAVPCGLAARDTLRLEAGMNLYGQDMTEKDTPLTSNMTWTVAWDHEFIGREALLAQKLAGPDQALVGLVMKDKGVLRSGMQVQDAQGRHGVITSGTFAPTLGHAIALARLPLPLPKQVQVDLRGRRVELAVVKPPFVRHGQVCFKDF